MIRVDRKRVSSPFENRDIEFAKGRLREYYQIRETERRQRKLPIDEIWLDIQIKVKNALLELFNAKCAYCESPISTSNSPDGQVSDFEIDRFRPLSGASNLDGKGSLDHYGWLALDWENMYAACKTCSRAKRSLFPIEGPRAMPLTPVEEINEFERALLIDPCRDYPERHLEFREDGSVQARDTKGEITIKTLNLNRAQLREARREV